MNGFLWLRPEQPRTVEYIGQRRKFSIQSAFNYSVLRVKGKVIPITRDARVHIFAATTLGRDIVANPTIGRLYPSAEKAPWLILQVAEWSLRPIWTRRREEKSPHLRHAELNPGRPARFQASCHSSYLAHVYGRLARWIKWRACDIGEAKEG